MILNKWQSALGLILAIGSVVGLCITLESHWARASEFKQLNMRFEEKVNSDRLDRIQERIWKTEDRYDTISKMPPTVKEEYRKLIEEKKWLEDKVKGGKP